MRKPTTGGLGRVVWLAVVLAAAASAFQDTGKVLLTLLERAREEKSSKDAVKLLEEARRLVESGADVNARGDQGRTALHWIAIGAAQWSDKKVNEAYRELAEFLIDNNADVNAEDDYGNTALDWEEASPEDQLRHVLEQAGARHGATHDEARRMELYINSLRAVAKEKDLAKLASMLEADFPVGTEIRVRLTKEVHSKQARSGDKVEAVVISPVRSTSRVVLEPGTKVAGTILAARKAGDRYSRAQVTMNLTNFLHRDGAMTRLATRIIEVDNARETVNYGRVLGVPFPNRAVSRWTMGLRGLGFVLPGVSEGLQWATVAYNATLGREIVYPPGTELILRVSVPENLKTSQPQKDWPMVALTPELASLVAAQPLRVKTPTGVDSDIVNLLFIGAAEDIESGFRDAGWLEARALGMKTGFKTVVAAMRQQGYEEAPFSKLLLEGKEPDYEFQKDLNTVAKRHHLRIYRRPETFQGQPVWVSSATHDIGIGVARGGTKWYHVIDPEIDKERQKVADDLLFAGAATGYTLVEREHAPKKASNATGDELRTDGRIMVLHLTGERRRPPAGSTAE
jgi:hypothetical protein